MSDPAIQRATLKAELIEAIEASDAEGRYSDEGHERIISLIDQLQPLSPIPRPYDEQDKVASPWLSFFAQFGPKHTAGKPIHHQSTFKTLSFAKFPAVPMQLFNIVQEIHHESFAYNNIHLIENLAGTFAGYLIVFGRYSIDPAEPKRYIVDFYRAEVRGANGESDAEVRAGFGFEPDQPLIADFTPPRLHSDVVYCDEDMRINFGSMGGVYVLRRLDHPGYSVSFAANAAQIMA